MEIEVFADIACPFTHVGLRRFVALRAERGLVGPILRLRAWPLELVNGAPLDGTSLVPKVAALRAQVAPDLFTGFDSEHFPWTTLPALALEVVAARQGPAAGERFSLAVRAALFEDGRDISDTEVLERLRREHGLEEPTSLDLRQVELDLAEGERRGVIGSPHFFTPRGDFFCPSLEISHGDLGYEVAFDETGFDGFIAAAIG